MKKYKYYLVLKIIVLALFCEMKAQNPVILDQFTADPTARVFGDKVYLYPSHDILTPEGKGLRKNWFCMEDYHTFSSSNLSDWTDHGVIVTQNKVPWVKQDSYSMWAPDCIEKNGKYYFYFPAPAKDTTYGRGFSIGVAVADNPGGPFIPEAKPIIGAHGIDPCVFIDKDGQAYLYWSMGGISVARLKDNMLELDSKPQFIANLPGKGLKEGPFVFERNGIYYLTFPHVENVTERLEYATGSSPMGPFKMTGVIMDETPNCWTNHHSMINLKNQWYLFYHSNDLSPKFDKNRSTHIDSMFFNADGTIQKVKPTLRGVGLTDASKKIQIDRYSQISEKGVSVESIDTLNYFKGWKTVFNSKGSWIQYNAVDFGKAKFKNVNLSILSKSGSTLQIQLSGLKGPVLAKVKISKSETWQTIKVPVSKLKSGIYNLVLMCTDENPVEVDWISFE